MRKTSIFFAAAALAAFSCHSVPDIPMDATATQLIQAGQDALEIPNYAAAEAYYKAVVQRYGMDTAIYIEARYELAHMYLKQKRYEEAYEILSEIQEIFANAEPGVLPAAYKKLAQMSISSIPEKYKDGGSGD
ncbi:MAG: tetratricopeptide repeat protein [Treponemataceae bacterium]|nr:tetratricopeptide repeat protein [Treponemataceae bacterium]